MKGLETSSNELLKKENNVRSVAATKDFSNWALEHKGAVSSAFSLIEDISKELTKYDEDTQLSWIMWTLGNKDEPIASKPPLLEKVFEKNGVKVTLEAVRYSLIFKVEAEGETFFVKREWEFDIRGKYGGVREVQASAKAKEILKGIDGVEVVDFKTGYENKKYNRKYFVAKWQSKVIGLVTYIFDIAPQDRNRLMARVQEIQNLLPDSEFSDIKRGNMFYDQKQDKIIVFDINFK